jgi:hypothetical protein
LVVVFQMMALETRRRNAEIMMLTAPSSRLISSWKIPRRAIDPKMSQTPSTTIMLLGLSAA